MATVPQTGTAPRWQTYTVYALMALLTFAFLASGFFKLSGAQMQIDNFTRWGYPIWFMYVTGAIEVISAVLLWPRQTRFWGAAGLGAVMLGATATHLINSEFFMLPVVLVLLALAGTVAWFNRPRRV